MSGKNLGVPVMIRALDDAQRDRWRAAAARERRNLSDWIRVTLDDAAANVFGAGRYLGSRSEAKRISVSKKRPDRPK